MNKKAKFGLKVVGCVLGAVVLGILTLAQINVCTLSNSNYNDHSRFFRDTFETNNNFGEIPLTRLSMIASHDALSDSIDYYSKANVNQDDHIANNKVIRALAKGAIVRLSKAQNDNIYNQLKAGIRFIDLRVTYVDGVYYTSHGLISDTLENGLMMMLQFLDENPGEFIVFDIVYFYPPSKEKPTISDWDKLTEYLKTVKYKNKSILDYDYNNGDESGETVKTFKELTYNNITQNGQVSGAVLCTNQEPVLDDCLFYKHSGNMYSQWANTIYDEKVLDSVQSLMKEVKEDEKYNDYMLINQTQTAPGVDRIWKSITSWSLLAKAHDHNRFMLDQKVIDLDDMFNTLPIYMCDYATCNDNGFNDELVAKLQERNNKLNLTNCKITL